MLKHTCMLLGAGYCHRVISALCVGDTFVFVTLGTVGVCEVLVIRFLWRLWCSRESASIGHDRANAATRHAAGPVDIETGAMPSRGFLPTPGSLGQTQEALT
jgi:hypothetical protein